MTPEPEPASLEAANPYELRVDQSANVPQAEVDAALASGELGFLHSFTTGSTLDGPGVRVVAWTSGCMWRCLYCHNPDTWTMRNGIPVSLAKATEELRKYRQGLKVMSGGLTISGGEPLAQDRFVLKLFAAAKAMGVHTALDSNGYLGERVADAELESIDLVLLDLKAWDEQRHRDLTGREPGPTHAFARRLAARGRPIWVRFVLVPGLTDDPGEVASIARFAASLGNVQRVDVLPFHQMGRFKWKKLGIPYRLDDVEPPSAEVVERVLAAFRGEGLKAY
jgi:pyruvate formate lyase activating enzyme